MPSRELRATRYLTAANESLARWLTDELPYLDFRATCRAYRARATADKLDDKSAALWGCNDRYFLFTMLLGRRDGYHPWVFDRCRELESAPDGYLDLWARYHFKSSLGTFGGLIQDVLINPEVTIAILSVTKPIAGAFLTQIQQELERNEYLKRIYSDVLWAEPRKEAAVWSRDKGIVVKRKGNPKEATIEAHGLIDGQPTSRHFDILNYDDIVTQDVVDNPDIVKKVTERWELSDNLGKPTGTRKRMFGTRWSFGDTYGVILERGILKARVYPATDGGIDGDPVLMSPERWAEVKKAQRSTVAAQMLLNPLADTDATFKPEWLKTYEIVPSVLNVYIMCDPSMGRTARSDRTAIAVIGLDSAGNRYLLDGYCHRMKLSERYEFIKQLRAKWLSHLGVQIVRVGYERYGQQVDLEVIGQWMERDKDHFELEELAFPREGQHSKLDRIRRLEPDLRGGKFYLPCTVHHPEFGGREGSAFWSVWTQDDADRSQAAGKFNHPIGHIVYRPAQGLTKLQRSMEGTMQSHRIVYAIKRRDENGDVYDLTRSFIAEAMFHPFAPHDDLLDAVSRLYDMEPRPPVQYESQSAEAPEYMDA